MKDDLMQKMTEPPARGAKGVRVLNEDEHVGMEMEIADLSEAHGTYACPICGYDKPHGHSEERQAAYRDDQIRDDGWISTIKISPKKTGWYLCHGVKVLSQQGIGIRDAQLSWFLWMRDGAARDIETNIPEVLFYSHILQRWSLRNLLGDALISGAEGRCEVIVAPKYWREVPPLGESKP